MERKQQQQQHNNNNNSNNSTNSDANGVGAQTSGALASDWSGFAWDECLFGRSNSNSGNYLPPNFEDTPSSSLRSFSAGQSNLGEESSSRPAMGKRSVL